MPRYLLDTNILFDLAREPRGAAAAQLARVGEQRVCTSIIVSAELRYGAAKADSPRLQERVELVLSALEILPLEPPADRHYAEIRYHLARQGLPIVPNDLLIAAQARSQDLILVTANTAEFTRVPALRVENWLDGGV